MTKAQRYHEVQRIDTLFAARFWRLMGDDARMHDAIRLARHHNRQALYVARLNRARQQAQSVSR